LHPHTKISEYADFLKEAIAVGDATRRRSARRPTERQHPLLDAEKFCGEVSF
jgi:hypothetical protein